MGILEFLRKSKEARKIFGKRELDIIEKQIMGINLTQSEKNRLSRDIRQKLEFISKAARFEEEFKLKKGARVKEMIEEAKNVILKSSYFPRIKKIILFGSTVENARTHRSDVDIAVEFDEIDGKEAGRFRIKTFFNDDVDIQVYNTLPEKIKKEIDAKGRVIWKRE
ncbi:MAG: nucleotidyltransferase domain-containing protein [Nanoarchaeota archaeon]|nr:nucleotidyltransferase domain-containing protein [Nanoarchaeota archaeon]